MTEHNTKMETVTLMGKDYQDLTYIDQPAVSAYIQCSWFSDKQIEPKTHVHYLVIEPKYNDGISITPRLDNNGKPIVK